MSDYTIPEPEPKEIDERLSVELSHLVDEPGPSWASIG